MVIQVLENNPNQALITNISFFIIEYLLDRAIIAELMLKHYKPDPEIDNKLLMAKTNSGFIYEAAKYIKELVRSNKLKRLMYFLLLRIRQKIIILILLRY